MTKQEYVKDRIKYYKDRFKLSTSFAKDCAKDDLRIYIEKYGEESLKNR